MAALVVAMAIMSIMMTVVMPVWRQAAQREKETELVFRGLQYAHAVGLYQRKFANAYPPNVDILVEQRFLRKKFKDPITNDDFAIIPPGAMLPGTTVPGMQRGGQATTPAAGAGAGRGGSPLATQTTTAAQPSSRGGLAPTGSQPGGIGGGATAGVAGVTSKSKAQSIRLYNGRGHYNEWAFVYIPQLTAGQTGAPGAGGPGQRGQQPGPPGVGPGRNQPGNDRGPGQRPSGPGGFGNPGPGGGFGNPGGGRPAGPGTQQPIRPGRN